MLEYLATMETADDRTRFESLYLAYRGLMYHVAYHILKNPQDAEDAVHQSFVKLAEHMATIPDGPCPRTRNLVVTVAERKAIDLYRSRQRHPETELDEQTVWSAPPEGGGLADAMASLPPRYREVLLLKYYNGYSAREIAGFLSATPDAVTQTLHRARKKLAEIPDQKRLHIFVIFCDKIGDPLFVIDRNLRFMRLPDHRSRLFYYLDQLLVHLTFIPHSYLIFCLSFPMLPSGYFFVKPKYQIEDQNTGLSNSLFYIF